MTIVLTKFHIFLKGAAMVAGRAVGKWDMTLPIPLRSVAFKSTITDDERDVRYSKWKMAVERSLGWEITPTN